MKQMEQQGWIASTIEQQSGKPNRKVYNMTDARKKELFRWLNEPPEELEPGPRVVARSPPHVERNGVDGIEEQVIFGEVVHGLSLPRRVAVVAAHLWRERADSLRLRA